MKESHEYNIGSLGSVTHKERTTRVILLGLEKTDFCVLLPMSPVVDAAIDERGRRTWGGEGKGSGLNVYNIWTLMRQKKIDPDALMKHIIVTR